MTKNVLLDRLKEFTEVATKDVICPVRLQKGDKEQKYRAADVYKMRLPDGTSATKKVPYIIHQVITGRDVQTPGELCEGSAVVRSVFAVYHEDEQEGSLLLLELMETLRVALLKQVVIGKQFELDLQAGLETLTYTENTAPYYAGEMISTWKLPAVKREVPELWQD
ncbi:MAG: hypothetical protein J6M06_01565 [Synergistaceae bacterium]|nr:hypothetical protein [Synergistaceae bacterium]